MAGVDDRAVRSARRSCPCRPGTARRRRSASAWPTSPIRVRRLAASAHASRSSDSARWLPRLFAASAWISSTITVRVVDEHLAARLRAEQHVQRLGRGDDDVRRRAAHALRARPAACRRCAPACGSSTSGSPSSASSCADARERRLEIALDVVGQRLERRDVDDLRSRRAAARPRPARTRSSIAARNAASVLPEPVGAAIRTFRPALIAGQASACAGVGAAKRLEPAGNGGMERG